MATEADFVNAAVEVGRAVDVVQAASDWIGRDRDSIPIQGGRLVGIVDAEYDGIVAEARDLIGSLEALIGELESRAVQCARYSERVDQYRRQRWEWDNAPPETRGSAPVRPQPSSPWMEAS